MTSLGMLAQENCALLVKNESTLYNLDIYTDKQGLNTLYVG